MMMTQPRDFSIKGQYTATKLPQPLLFPQANSVNGLKMTWLNVLRSVGTVIITKNVSTKRILFDICAIIIFTQAVEDVMRVYKVPSIYVDNWLTHGLPCHRTIQGMNGADPAPGIIPSPELITALQTGGLTSCCPGL